MLLRMQAECREYVKEIEGDLLVSSLSKRDRALLKDLLQQWQSAQGAIETLLSIQAAEPERDIDDLGYCVLWFMVVMSCVEDDSESDGPPRRCGSLQ